MRILTSTVIHTCVYFQDRFAEGRALQAIDESQDWILEFGKEESGYTILGFRRSITTCDPKDLDILVCAPSNRAFS